MKIDPEFKKALSLLELKEKDKLIIRLLKRDIVLTKRLYFELVDDLTVSERRSEIESRIDLETKRMGGYLTSTGALMMELRYLSGEITEHVKITKDKVGEVSLNLRMLNQTLSLTNKYIEDTHIMRAQKLCVYIISRAFKILVLIDALHEDFFVDFKEGLEKLGDRIGRNHNLMTVAIHNGFDVNWLLRLEIPENISEIHTQIRKQGFLK